jgi:MFS family permease
MPSASTRINSLQSRALDNPKYPRWLLIVTLTGIFSTGFPSTILSISIKSIADDLHSSNNTITWVTTAPMLAAAVCTPIFGRLGDLRGHRRLYLIGLASSGIFSLLSAFAWGAFSLIILRTLSQIGAAAMVPSTFAMLFRSFPEGERVRASALSAGTGAAAAVLGVVIGGPLVDLIGWRPIFLIQAPIAFLVLIPALIVLRKDELVEDKKPVDYAGGAALAVATFALTFGVNRLGASGLTPVSVVSLAVVPVAVWVLIRIERRSPAPLLPLHILSARNTWVVAVGTFLLFVGFMGTFLITPLLLQSVMGLSVGVTAVIVVPRALAGLCTAPFSGRLGVRVGERTMVIGSCVMLAAVMCLLAFGADTKSIPVIVVGLVLAGVAFGGAQPGLVAAVSHSVSPADFGLATSLQQTAGQIGSVVGIGLFASIAANSTTPGPFALVFLLAGGLSLLTAIVATWLHRRPILSSAAMITDAEVDAEVAVLEADAASAAF